MADLRLRELARTARRGDPAARARLLVERLRTGALLEPRLRVAALAGDRAASLALGLEAPRPGPPLVEWVDGLRVGGREPLVRAAVAAARCALVALRDHPPLRDWAAAVVDLAQARLAGRPATPPRRPPGWPTGAPGSAIRAADLLLQVSTAPDLADQVRQGAPPCAGAAVVAGHAADAAGRARVRAAVRRDLIRWALEA